MPNGASAAPASTIMSRSIGITTRFPGAPHASRSNPAPTARAPGPTHPSSVGGINLESGGGHFSELGGGIISECRGRHASQFAASELGRQIALDAALDADHAGTNHPRRNCSNTFQMMSATPVSSSIVMDLTPFGDLGRSPLWFTKGGEARQQRSCHPSNLGRRICGLRGRHRFRWCAAARARPVPWKVRSFQRRSIWDL